MQFSIAVISENRLMKILQAMEAVEGARASLGRLEAALTAREAKLADAWKVLRTHAGRILSDEPHSPDSNLQVS